MLWQVPDEMAADKFEKKLTKHVLTQERSAKTCSEISLSVKNQKKKLFWHDFGL